MGAAVAKPVNVNNRKKIKLQIMMFFDNLGITHFLSLYSSYYILDLFVLQFFVTEHKKSFDKYKMLMMYSVKNTVPPL